MPDVILIRPISESWAGEAYKRHVSIPHGPLTLAAHLIDKGFSVQIIDEIALTTTVAQDRLLDLLEEAPVCIGITTMTGMQIRMGRKFASLVRETNPNIPIVWGGAHPTILPEMTIKDEYVDIVVYGEGDISFPFLVSQLKEKDDISKVPGIYYMDNNGSVGTVLHTDAPPPYDLNLIPELPYHLLDMELYITSIKKKYITRYFEINSSRGCPFNCAFCYNSKEDSTYTKKDSEKIIKEIKYLLNNYHIDGLTFSDENFIVNSKRMREIAETLVNLDMNLHIRSGGRIELFVKFDDDMLKLIKEAGFYHFGFGIESGSEITLRMINKKITLKQIYDTVDKIRKHGFQATYNFIAGFPNETITEYKKTLALIHHIFENSTYVVYPVPAPSYFVPFPGTISHDETVKLGYESPTTFDKWSDIDYNIDEMPWLKKDFHDFIVESREIINNINQKFTGDDAVITKSDLAPLRKIIN